MIRIGLHNANKHDCECEEGRAVLAALYLTVQRGTHKADGEWNTSEHS
jgi:hypothetical protein